MTAIEIQTMKALFLLVEGVFLQNVNHIIDSLLTPENRSYNDLFMDVTCAKEKFEWSNSSFLIESNYLSYF